MSTTHKSLVDLERKFWQSMVDQDTDTALGLLHEPALMVSEHGSMKFDHAGYRKMAEQGTMVVTGFDFDDVEVVFPSEDTAVMTYRVKQTVVKRGGGDSKTQEMADSSTWVRSADGWKCAIHTETPAAPKDGARPS